ncbi:MAG TPA: hypothetical protein GX519_05150 [Thermoanaerobacterales bacterium]|nr:hypothetical protein [Thermoanaerobacterales bacterium]
MDKVAKIPNKFHSKGEICSFLEDHMANTYEKIKDEGEYEYGKNLVKTYVIESNYDDVKAFFNSLNGKSIVKWKKVGADAFILDYKKEDLGVNFYIDAVNPRFWAFHTISSAKDTDSVINKMVQPMMSRLDTLWLDRTMLQEIRIEHADYIKSIGIQYKYGDVFPSADFGDSFSLRANGTPSEILMKIFLEDPELSNLFALSSVGFKKNLNTNDELETYHLLIEDVNYQGKFTVKGTTINEHFSTISEIRDNYEKILNEIEHEYNISYKPVGGGFTIHGGPLCIDLKKKIENLQKFIQTVFTAREPFRLSGFPTKVDSDTYLISGLDLHNGDDFRLEITPEWIRVYLPKDACGNTVMRFLCNLQRYYDPNASLEGMNNGRII